MVVNNTKIYHLFWFTLNLMYECGGRNYDFEIDMIESFSNVQADENTKKEIEEHSLSKLNQEEQSRLCILAKENASRKEVQLRYVDTEEIVNKFTIFKEENKRTKAYIVVGLKCPFIPFVLLHLEEQQTKNRITTIVQVNPFLDRGYRYKEKVVDHVEYVQTVSSDSKLEWRENYAYSKLNYKTRWMLCVAAIARIRHNVTMPPSDDWFEIVGVYDITYLADSESNSKSNSNSNQSKMVTVKDVVAFPCNSSPMMYLSVVTKNDFVATLVRY